MKLSVLYIILIAFSWANYTLYLDHSHVTELETHILDVGQGLGVLIEYNGYTFLIDTGPDVSIIDELGDVLPSFHNNIDAVIITHPHNDHYMGLFHLLGFYHPRTIIFSRLIASNYTYSLLFDLVKQTHEPFFVQDEARIHVEDLEIRIIQLPPPYNNRNNASVVTLITFYDHTLLITGDLESDYEKKLLAQYDIPHIDHYVAGHHGSKTSSGEPFLRAIQPNHTYISVGEDNSFGHPSPETISALDSIGSTVHMTKDLGRISLICPKTGSCTYDFAH